MVDNGKAGYVIFGREKGDNGTPHLQGYVELLTRQRLQPVKVLLGGRAHCEISRGTSHQAIEYCKKEGDYEEYGRPKQGRGVSGSGELKRSRDDVAEDFEKACKEGKLQNFIEENKGQWYYNNMQLERGFLRSLGPVERPNVACVWLYGAPGRGKSRVAHEVLSRAFLKEPKTKWWNGYLGEKTVIIDDFAPESIDLNHFLRWFDRYGCPIETKGGMTYLQADKFIVTSNFTPAQVYENKSVVELQALGRRIKCCEVLCYEEGQPSNERGAPVGLAVRLVEWVKTQLSINTEGDDEIYVSETQ